MRKVMVLLIGCLLAGCQFIDPQPSLTPIILTATQQQFLIVTSTFTPSPSPVVAPTLQGQESADFSTPTPRATATTIITMTPTFTPTPTDTPVTPGAFIAPVGGVVSGGGTCATQPDGGFGTVYTNNPELAAQLGCPLAATAQVQNAYQSFERGIMVWAASVGGQSGIFAIYNDGTFQRFNDTWRDGVDPVSVGLSPPGGLLEPIRGFGKVWRESPGVSEAIGWANGAEVGGTAAILLFERGEMIYIPQNGQTYVLIAGAPGTWVSLAQPY
jgi:serine/threonine-protein kinase